MTKPNASAYPRITLVTPNFNGAEFLEDCMTSVFDQGYPNLEYIVIDGGSTDDSVRIIKKYARHLSWWTSEPDRGPYYAIQKGFSKSTGEVMAWINSDDILHRNGLFVVTEIFTVFHEIRWLMGRTNHIDESGRVVYCSNRERWSKYRYYIGKYVWIQQESTFWRRSLWEDAGGRLDTSLSLAADLELWNRFFRYDKLYTIDALIGAFRIRAHNQRSLEGMEIYEQEASDVLARNVLTPAEIRRVHVIRLFQTIMKFVVLRKLLKNIYDWLFEYPHGFKFDRLTQRYVRRD